MKISNLIGLFLVTFAAFTLVSCSKDSDADLRDLLSTVPSDAGVVGSANLKKMAECADIKLEDGKIKNAAFLLSKIAAGQGNKNASQALFEEILPCVEISSMVYFTQGYYSYVTGLVSDPEEFKKAVEKALKGKNFTVENDVDICETVALKGNQFWIGDTASAIDGNTIKGFVTLSEKQSYLSNEYSSKLLEMDHSMEAIADLGGLFSRMGGGLQNMAATKIALGALFSDPAYISMSVDFEKGELSAKINILDSKYRPAKYLLPTDKISSNTLSALPGSGEVLVAMAIPEKLFETFSKLGKSFGGSIDSWLAPLKCIDGTVAFIVSDVNATDKRINGIIDINKESPNLLTGLLSSAGMTTKIEKNQILVSTNSAPSGPFTGQALAPEFKDAMLAFTFSSKIMENNSSPVVKGLDKAIIKFVPDDGSLQIKIEAYTLDKKKNFLKTLINR